MNPPNKTQPEHGFVGDAHELIERLENGEDVQDAIIHKLRTFAAGCDTLMKVSDEQSRAIESLKRQRDEWTAEAKLMRSQFEAVGALKVAEERLAHNVDKFERAAIEWTRAPHPTTQRMRDEGALDVAYAAVNWLKSRHAANSEPDSPNAPCRDKIAQLLQRLDDDLLAIKHSAAENSTGDPPEGYSEMEDTPAQLVADACWEQGINAMETSIRNWIHDQRHENWLRTM